MASGSPHTLAEKILALKAGKREVSPGEIVDAKVDVAMAHEACAQVVKPLDEMGATKLWDPDRVVVPIDHWVPASTEASAKLHATIREFVQKWGIRHFYDIGNQGICHQIMVEEGFVLPGDLMVGTDSHSNMAGAMGAFASGIGPTEMAAVMATGEIWLRVPETFRMRITGELSFPVQSKDLVLSIIGRIGDDGGRYMAVEFDGSAIEKMPMYERFTLTNMTTEMGAKTGIIPADAKTLEYLRNVDVKNGRRGEVERYAGLRSDANARFAKSIEIDASALEPVVAMPHSPDNVRPVREVDVPRVDQVFVGSCTNARLEDMRTLARIIKGQKVARGTRLVVFPASTSIYKQCLKEGIVEIVTEAGGIFNAASCGACFGGMGGVLASQEICVSTSNRNYVGRMGHPKSLSYLVSPATAAVTAIEGRLVDPREFVGKEMRRDIERPMTA
ncbi:MAG TPA: 3-isopropylmalate dehydratase large subunit [Candidatus Thermoplasmatota archaeon]|nr:3-isopropylmalate dehydratase large subunit [Candidatus Thermoplasmatota archaeon]